MVWTKRFGQTILVIGVMLLFHINTYSQVKIGDNHTNINPGSLLELESRTKGVLFPRIALNNDLKQWMLDGVPADGMVVYNTNTSNPLGLYVWYNLQWNLLGGGSYADVDYVEFDNATRILNDDGDKAVIPSSRVRNIGSEADLLNYLKQNYPTEGDIFNLPGTGIYIRNDSVGATTVRGGYIFIATVQKPGYILYSAYTNASNTPIDPSEFIKGLDQEYYIKPDTGAVFSVGGPPPNGGYYAFAVPSEWATPRIFLKVANTNGGFFKLNDCWKVARNMEYNGVKYQVWALDVPLTSQVMDADLQFRIE